MTRIPDLEVPSLTQAEALAEEFDALFSGEFAANPVSGEEGDEGGPFGPFHRAMAAKGGPTALCLSGGGIRSATFCLGVLQSLGRAKWLDRFDYLSTVSGGGYLGSFLTRWRVDAKQGWDQGQLNESPDQFAKGENGVHPVRRLRSYSNFLAPSWGVSMDGLTFVSGVLRKFLFNFLFWGFAFSALGLLAQTIAAGLDLLTNGAEDLPGFIAGGDGIAMAICVVVAMLLLFYNVIEALYFARDDEEAQERVSRNSARVLSVLWPVLLVFVLFVTIPRWVSGLFDNEFSWSVLTALGVSLVTALSGYWSRLGPNLQSHAQALMEKIKVYYLQIVSAISIVALAVVGGLIGNWLLTVAGSIGFRKAFTPSVQSGTEDLELPEKAMEIVEGRLVALCQQDGCQMEHFAIYFGIALLFFATLSSAALFFSWVAGANRSSLHSIYATRLIRAFLGSARKERHSNESDECREDDIPLTEMFPREGRNERFPLFHVINMTLNLSRGGGHRRDWQERRGASFFASALHVGSAALGGREDGAAQETPAKAFARSEYMYDEDDRSGWFARRVRKRRKGLTLGRAMAISGAAASPNMGYYSRALTAFAMSIFNVRLGWWLQNPGTLKRNDEGDVVPAIRNEPTFGWLRVLCEALTMLNERSDWLYLSDGGHFENLGLYEMVRRRCAQILVVDAGCDPDFEHSDLHNAVRKIYVDLGIPIDLPAVLPGQEGSPPQQRATIGCIRYSALDPGMNDGILVVIKPRMVGTEPPSLAHYRENSRTSTHAFPHHSTADQFFDETQFESYRQLGETSGVDVMRGLPDAIFTKAESFTGFAGFAQIKDSHLQVLGNSNEEREDQEDSVDKSVAGPRALPAVEATDPSIASRTANDNGSAPAGAGASKGFGGLGGFLSHIGEWSMTELVLKTGGAAALVGAGITGGQAAMEGLAENLPGVAAPEDPRVTVEISSADLQREAALLGNQAARLGDEIQALGASVADVRTAIDSFEQQQPSDDGGPDDGGPGPGPGPETVVDASQLEAQVSRLNELMGRFEALETRLRSLGGNGDVSALVGGQEEIRSALRDLAGQIAELQGRVNDLDPRRNVGGRS